jgi:microcystin-dependent protein
MSKNIIIFSLIYILFILIIYLFYKVNQIKDSPPPTNPPVDNPEINLDNYYTKNDMNNNFYNKTYFDNNIQNSSSAIDTSQNSSSAIDTSQNGNIYTVCGNQEFGYDIEIDDTITFNHPIVFKENINFNDPVDFNNQVDFNNPVDFDNNLNIDHNNLINTLPPGSIIAWSSETPPKGWALCDGQNRTPDLRGRFILGAGQGTGLTERTLGDSSGDETVTIGSDNLPKHSHSYEFSPAPNDNGYVSGDDGKNAQCPNIRTWDKPGDIPVHDEDCKVNENGEKIHWGNNHSVKSISTGNSDQLQYFPIALNNMPPYYVLTYIIKL